MSNPENDSRLEQLSREAADRYTVMASPSWDKMEKELDKILPTEKKKRRPFIFWWIIAAILLGGSMLWYIQKPLDEKQISNQVLTKQGKSDKISFDSTLANSTLKKEEIISTDPSKNTVKASADAIYRPSLSSPKQLKSESFSSVSVQQKTSRESVSITEEKNETKQFSNPSTTNKENITKAENTVQENVSLIRPTIDTGSNLTNASINHMKDTSSIMEKVLPEQPIVTHTDVLTPNTKKVKKAFSFAIVAGLDATTVKFRYADKASASGGIIIGYHLNNNWSIHTGGLYTRKNYKMDGRDFKAPAGSWVANYKLETVDGFCTMWEIPLLARYTFDTKTKTRAFVSGGLSSYLMTRENYNYFYYFNGSPVRRNANYPDGKTHPFSILKLSAGWIRETHKSSSLVVEPFANLPLSGLGFGSAKLSSFGIYFSYQFRQPNKKK
jgi:cytoskeletal protein RodZ